jgi:uncharacterized membrane protein
VVSRKPSTENAAPRYVDLPVAALVERIPELKTLQPAPDQQELPTILQNMGRSMDNFARNIAVDELSSRDLVIGNEILGRTSPSMVDLLVGFVGGLAGGFTFVSTGLSGVVVGVAIATSLVPPLTTCGILLARHSPFLAKGAFLLFLANFAAIALGAMITFLLAGYRPAAADKAKKVLLPRLVCLALGLLLAFHLNGTLRRASAQSILQSNMRKTLAKRIAKIPGSRLVDISLSQRNGRISVWAVATHSTAHFPGAGRWP